MTVTRWYHVMESMCHVLRNMLLQLCTGMRELNDRQSICIAGPPTSEPLCVTTEAGEEAVAAAVYPQQAQGGGLGQGGLRIPEGSQLELVPVGKGATALASVQCMVNSSGAQSPAMSEPGFDGGADQGTQGRADRIQVRPKMLVPLLAIQSICHYLGAVVRPCGPRIP